MTNLIEIKKQVAKELADKDVLRTLIATTFKGLNELSVKQAIVEGMMRGFTFDDFLNKNVYAIPFGQGYSLVTSIDHARKIGMRNGIVGTSEPKYEEKDNKIISCTVTVKRKVGEYIGEYSATAFFTEYNTDRNLWRTKPRTMIAKVAEMHALRKACPEELSQSYVEEEMSSSVEKKEVSLTKYEDKLSDTKSLDELRKVFLSLPGEVKKKLRPLADKLKSKYENK